MIEKLDVIEFDAGLAYMDLRDIRELFQMMISRTNTHNRCK